MRDNPSHCLDILDSGWAWNLSSMLDGRNGKTQAAALGHVFVPWFSAGTNGARGFR
jgi:hypothetical protein